MPRFWEVPSNQSVLELLVYLPFLDLLLISVDLEVVLIPYLLRCPHGSFKRVP